MSTREGAAVGSSARLTDCTSVTTGTTAPRPALSRSLGGRPVQNFVVPDACRCGLFHWPGNHDRPEADFVRPGRCKACRKLRCDQPRGCAFRHADETHQQYRQRLERED